MNDDRFGFLTSLRTRPAGGIVLGLACAVAVVTGAQVVIGATEIGIGVDDYIHALRTDAWLKFGWYIPEYTFAGGEPDPNRGDISPYVYGAAFSGLAHLVNVALGNESMGEVMFTGDAYAVKHLTVAAFGLAAVACVGVAVWTLTRNALAAVWSSAALLAIPVWSGYAMFSIKDIPVAAGFTFVTLALLLALTRAGERPWPPSRRTVGVAALIAVGVLFCVGVRPVMWVPLLCALAAYGVLAFGVTRSRSGAGRSLAAPGVGFAIGLAGVMALHPRTAPDPLEWLVSTVSEVSEAGREGVYTLTAGQLLSEFPPAWYLPAWTFASVPVLIFAIAAAGAWIVIRSVVRARPGQPGDRGPELARTGGMLLVGLQLVLLPAATIITGGTSYTGLRQHLYLLPPVAILAGIGAARLLAAGTGSDGSSGRARWLVAGVLCLALVVPTVEQTRLYPYNYVYVNEAAGIGGVQDRWESEYQFIGAREAFQRVPDGMEPKCSARMIPPEGVPFVRPLIEDCYASLPPYYDEVPIDPRANRVSDEIWVMGRPRGGNRPPGFCTEEDNVTRPLRGEDIVMTYVLRCTPPSKQGSDRGSSERAD